MLTAIVVGVVAAVAGSVLTWYLQRRFTPDPTAEVVSLRKEVVLIREQFAEFKEHAETAEKERSKFENFPFKATLCQGAYRNCIIEAKNDSEYQVSVESIQILRGDTDHESPLTPAVPPRPNDDWTIDAGQSKRLSWDPQGDPAFMLQSLIRDPDPRFPDGRVMPIMFAFNLQCGGRHLVKKHAQQVCFQRPMMIPWGP